MQYSTTKTHRLYVFDSPKELYEHAIHVLGTVKDGTRCAANAERLESDDQYRINFRGATLKEIRERFYSWPEGVKKLAEYPEFKMLPLGAELKPYWNYYDGISMDMDRFRDGRPFLQARKKATGNKLKHANIIINLAENCGTEADALLCKGLAALKMVDDLEAQGIRAAITAKITVNNSFENAPRDFEMTITIKRLEEPLNPSMLATVLAPWFFRHWALIILACEHEDAVSSYGTAVNMPRNEPEGTIYIDKGDCLNIEAAREKIKELNALTKD